MPTGSTLDLNGLHLYARATQIGGNVINGSISIIQGGGPVVQATLTPGTIASSGEIDDWSFFGRAGQSVNVYVGTGAGSQFAPIGAGLGFAQVQLIAPGRLCRGHGDQ